MLWAGDAQIISFALTPHPIALWAKNEHDTALFGKVCYSNATAVHKCMPKEYGVCARVYTKTSNRIGRGLGTEKQIRSNIC